MDLRDYLNAIRKRWWFVAGSMAIAVGAAMLVTTLTPPRYAASVTFFISAQTKGGVSDAYQGDLFSQKRVTSYVDLLTSDRLAKMVVASTPTGLTFDQVQARITAQAVPDTVLLRASVTDRDRGRALRLTDLLATQFGALVGILETPPGGTVPAVRIEVIAGPRVAAAPVAPTPLRNAALGLILGLVAGIGAAALREALDTTVKSAEVLSQLASAPVLATIPFDPRAKKAPLIIEGSARSSRAEALRQLRTNLRFVSVDRSTKTMVITSAVSGEGKSATACNLAIVLAEAGHRVVLVDADLRRPRLADYLGLEGAVGLTNVLADQARLDTALQQWGSTGIFVLPRGSNPPNPSELLGSRQMAVLLETLKDAFDTVIIDTPPLLPVTDAAVLASIVDGTVLVSQCGKTTAAQTRSAVTTLDAVGARLLGCVLNMTPRQGSAVYYAYDDARSAASTPSIPESTVKSVSQSKVKTG
jgi:capsular exopolysaccharide synthesis family protein